MNQTGQGMNQTGQGSGWPSAFVAVGVLALIGAIAVTGEIKYGVEDFIKVWTALAGLVGVVTGAVVTYFFTRATVSAAQATATTAARTADQAESETRRVKARARDLHAALQRVAASNPELANADPSLARAVAEEPV